MSLRDLGIFAPLHGDHPCITNKDTCWLCGSPFHAGQRTALVPMEADSGPARNVQAKIVHADCRWRGREIGTPDGLRVVERIKEGDGSPFPVLTTDGKQWKDEEISRPA